MATLIKNGIIVNEGLSFKGSLLVSGEVIERVISEKAYNDRESYEMAVKEVESQAEALYGKEGLRILDAENLVILPGVIDDQVHFREPGACNKADIESESKAAALGGVTSFMDMPNNNPPATTIELLEKKFGIAAEKSYCNYSFYLGATNDNAKEISLLDKSKVCGIKAFMGTSTGNMLINDPKALENLFSQQGVTVATHCEEESIIKENTQKFIERYGEEIPIGEHTYIRSREACIECTKRAVGLALKYGTKLHILHLSTADEIEILKRAKQENPNISGEICIHYLMLSNEDFANYGTKIKCNPAIKEKSDMQALRRALKEGVIKVLATDHAPHLEEEKRQNYMKAPSGLPLIQHSLQLMVELVREGHFTIEEVADFMSHSPANCFGVEKRGFIREGYFADLAILDLNQTMVINKDNIAYKCKWSPFEGKVLHSKVLYTFVNGTEVVSNGELTGSRNAKRLIFSPKNN